LRPRVHSVYFACTCLIGLIAYLLPSAAHAQSSHFSFTKIADTTRSYSPPALDDGHIAYWGIGADGVEGIYTGPIGDPIELAVSEASLVPGAVAPFERILSDFGFDAGSIAFQGYNDEGSGIYLFDKGAISKIADTNTPIPSATGNFRQFGWPPSVDNERVVFEGQRGSTVGVQPLRGAYVGGAGGLSRIADSTMSVPNDTRLFSDSFAVPLINDDRVIFVGNRWNRPGIYSHNLKSGLQTRLVDTNSLVPGRPIHFTGFNDLGPGLDIEDAKLGFIGEAPFVAGVYTMDLDSGALEMIADMGTLVPGGGLAQFDRHFTAVSTNGNSIAFGYGTVFLYGGWPPPDSPYDTPFFGVYTNLGGSLEKLVDKGDALDGKLVSRAHLGRQGLDGDQIAVTVEFDDGSKAIYVATLIPEPNTLAMLIPAVRVLTICVRMRAKRARMTPARK
jgi:hypothetical protein